MIEERYTGDNLKYMLIEGAKALSSSKEKIDSLNVFPVPDGDTGTNMNLTMQTACQEINKIDSNDLTEIADVFSNGSLMGARGNSGVILSQLFRGMFKYLREHNNFDATIFTNSLVNGVNTAYKAVLKPVEGTMLTVAKDTALGAREHIRHNKDSLSELLEVVIESAETSLDRTQEQLPALKEAGVVDAGGMGLVVIYKGMLEGLKKSLSKSSTIEEDISGKYEGSLSKESDKSYLIDDYLGPKYCTEVMIKGKYLSENEFREKLSSMGESLLVIGNENILKVHIHTDRPGLVIDECSRSGELSNVKIDNMKKQHEEFIKGKKEDHHEDEEDEKEVGLIAIATGEGFKEIFESMGADKVITGGQSMNPSTQEIMEAVKNIKQDKVLLLPNNKNIIMSCKQVADLSQKEIKVIETRSIPQGISSMMEFDPSLDDLNDIMENMKEAFNEVISGAVTYAVRNTTINNTHVSEGDYIGLIEGEIFTSSKSLEEVSYETANKIISQEDKEILSIFTGEGTSKEEADKLKERIENNTEDVEVEIYYGGQPLYYYIFSGE